MKKLVFTFLLALFSFKASSHDSISFEEHFSTFVRDFFAHEELPFGHPDSRYLSVDFGRNANEFKNVKMKNRTIRKLTILKQNERGDWDHIGYALEDFNTKPKNRPEGTLAVNVRYNFSKSRGALENVSIELLPFEQDMPAEYIVLTKSLCQNLSSKHIVEEERPSHREEFLKNICSISMAYFVEDQVNSEGQDNGEDLPKKTSKR